MSWSRIAAMSLSMVLLAGSTSLAERVIRVNTGFADPWYQALYKQFEAETGIKVELTKTEWGNLDKLTAAVAAGEAPDVALIDSERLAIVSGSGLSMDLTPFLKQDPQVVRDLPPPMVAAVGGDKGVGVPDDFFDMYAIWYNRDSYQNAGLAEPVQGWTYDDYETNAKKMTHGEGAGKVYGSSPPIWEPVAWAAGGKLIGDDGHFGLDNQPSVDALQRIYDWVWKDGIVPQWGTWEGSWQKWFANGHTQMHWSGPWYSDSYLKGIDLNWGIAPPPAGVAGPATMLFVNGWTILNGSQHVQDAWTFIKWFESDKVWRQRASRYVIVPATAARRQDHSALFWSTFGSKWTPVLSQTLEAARPIPFSKLASDVKKAVNKALGKAESNEVSVKVALDGVTPQVEKLIADAKAKAAK